MRRVVCAGTRAPEMALRLKYAGWPPDAIEVEPEIEASLDRAVGGAQGRLFALPTYTALLELRKLLAGARPGEGVLAMSAAAWHDVECGGYSADLALWEEMATEAGGPVLDLGCGTGRVGLHLGEAWSPGHWARCGCCLTCCF